jgi:hypothetical protein
MLSWIIWRLRRLISNPKSKVQNPKKSPTTKIKFWFLLFGFSLRLGDFVLSQYKKKKKSG